MLYLIGVENNVEGRSMAWALDYPGCFAYGESSDLALAAMPDAIVDYADWIARRNRGKYWLDIDQIGLYLSESFDVYMIGEDFELAEQGYEVNAWFRSDWRSLTDQDVARGLQLLSWGRADLLDAVKGLPPQMLELSYPGERWSIAGILKHVGGAEWWYLDRLGLAMPREQLPENPFERLEAARARLVEILPSLVGSKQVTGVEGEFWSPRKLLRRAIWHERDHTFHIHKLR